jgi:hypothetical protein
MKMFEAWTRALDKPVVRIILFTFGLVATAVFAPISTFGATLLFLNAPHTLKDLGWPLLGLAGLLGIIGAWVRLLTPRTRIERSKILKIAIYILLFPSIVLSCFLLFYLILNGISFISMFGVISLPIGVFLLGATIGAQSKNL